MHGIACAPFPGSRRTPSAPRRRRSTSRSTPSPSRARRRRWRRSGRACRSSRCPARPPRRAPAPACSVRSGWPTGSRATPTTTSPSSAVPRNLAKRSRGCAPSFPAACATSALCDAARFTRQLEDLLREAWRTWCARRRATVGGHAVAGDRNRRRTLRARHPAPPRRRCASRRDRGAAARRQGCRCGGRRPRPRRRVPGMARRAARLAADARRLVASATRSRRAHVPAAARARAVAECLGPDLLDRPGPLRGGHRELSPALRRLAARNRRRARRALAGRGLQPGGCPGEGRSPAVLARRHRARDAGLRRASRRASRALRRRRRRRCFAARAAALERRGPAVRSTAISCTRRHPGTAARC